ncbi:class I SAM-dependent methyltransferase [Chondromyces crocatus]|uniref:class I SAM-dependent methyltransferase n=1 Tax=Chondromyces crocatus TaxID=52 RepID=UPI001FE18CDD|nr:class I SAM-dependent methyltransferase [Chondromyces crocatus]
MSPSQSEAQGPPDVVDQDADRRFRERALALGWNPDDVFVGGYVSWEWERSRHAFQAIFGSVRRLRVLELGCHLGATGIVLASLGAEVTGVDISEKYVELAQLNAARHGLGDRVRVMHLPDTTRMPFESGSFDVISCNSVLEYVPPEILGAVQREIDRVLAPGGYVVVLGTSNRLWPKESHSARWGVSYVPQRLQQALLGFRVESVSPFRLRAGFAGYRDLGLRDGGKLLMDLKTRMGVSGKRRQVLSAANRLLLPLGAHVGFISPTITMILQKP